MRRIWFGVAVLVLFLLLSWFTAIRMQQIHVPIQKSLLSASRCSDFDQAARLSLDAQNRWRKYRRITASVTEHADMDEIEVQFAQLEVCRQRRDETAHARTCAGLAEAVGALNEVHRLTWWNIL